MITAGRLLENNSMMRWWWKNPHPTLRAWTGGNDDEKMVPLTQKLTDVELKVGYVVHGIVRAFQMSLPLGNIVFTLSISGPLGWNGLAIGATYGAIIGIATPILSRSPFTTGYDKWKMQAEIWTCYRTEWKVKSLAREVGLMALATLSLAGLTWGYPPIGYITCALYAGIATYDLTSLFVQNIKTRYFPPVQTEAPPPHRV